MSLAHVVAAIRCSQKAYRWSCTVPNSKFIIRFLNALLTRDLINGFKVEGDLIRIYLKYFLNGRRGVLSQIKLLTRPGNRQFCAKEKFCGFTPERLLVISSRHGVTVVRAYSKNSVLVGGEFLVKI